MEPRTAVEGLDDEQRAVAESLHGPVVVLAGAGTGKTRAITHRIAHGVATGAHDPRRSLAVTFTTRAAGEMRTRLRGLGVSGVQVRTFHSAALAQLRYFWPRLAGGSSFPEIIASKARVVAEAAHRCGVATDTATVRDLSADIEWASVNFLRGDAIAETATRVNRVLAAPAQMAAVQTAYEELKSARGLIDFEDVLLVTVGALNERPDIADEVRRVYRWFTVDEFQDVNPLQHRLLQLWLGDRDDVCVVGDANQTIYTFTGATPRYLTEFRTTFPDATEVRLVRCYRCTPEIVGLANGVIAGGRPSPSTLVLRSQRPEAERPTVEVFDDDVDEAAQVVARARDYIRGGTPARDIAVLFRINAQSAELEEAFAEAGIPVLLRGTERFFDRPEVRDALARLRTAARTGGPHDESPGAVTLGDTVRAVLSATGWSVEAPRGTGAVRDRWESLSAIATLADELTESVGGTLGGFVAELEARAQLQHAPVADGVTLASIHAAKGLEWKIVFVVGCSDGLLPLQYAETPAQIEEERRLAYVAMTRAADRLHLSWARARQPGGRANRNPSPFLAAAGAGPATTGDGLHGSIHRGSGKARGERKRKGPAKCRVCRKALVTAEERTLGRCRGCRSDVNDALLDALRDWRLTESRERSVPAYVVFTDATLIAIAEQLPADEDALADIPGVGPKKLDEYADAVLDLVRAHA